MTEASSGGVYLDTNAFVYAIQANDEIAAAVRRLLSEMSRLDRKPLTSELTLAEILCKKDLAPELIEIYRDLLVESETIRLEPVTRDILITSAELRRTGSSLKLQDAIHVATALNAGCKFMLSNDAGLRVALPLISVLSPTKVNVDQILDALHV